MYKWILLLHTKYKLWPLSMKLLFSLTYSSRISRSIINKKCAWSRDSNMDTPFYEHPHDNLFLRQKNYSREMSKSAIRGNAWIGFVQESAELNNCIKMQIHCSNIVADVDKAKIVDSAYCDILNIFLIWTYAHIVYFFWLERSHFQSIY